MDATERLTSTSSDWLRFGLLPLVARLLLGAEFAIAANGKISGWDGQAAYMAAHGLHWITPLLAMALIINLGMMGGLLLVTVYGPGSWALSMPRRH